MSKPTTSSSRRDFLRAGATLFGGSALGVLPALAAATPVAEATQVATGAKAVGVVKGVEAATGFAPTVSYWDGARFVPAASLRSGDASFDAVRLTLVTVGVGGLDAIEAFAPVPGIAPVPSLIWVGRPAGVDRSVTTVALDRAGGISPRLGRGQETATLRLVNGLGSGAKLRPGTYVISGSPADLRAATIDGSGRLRSRSAVAGALVVVTVEAA